ncbi:MAG: hypothetical protein HYZ28_08320 [Myxococcales bacterium]|nr:hypothetical protein [Myxococcales bacterium]
MAVPPIELSRYCVPYTPFKRRLEEATICLVSSAGVRARADAPFNPDGDAGYRAIDGTASTAELTYDDKHYEHGCVDSDLNCVFPLDRLHELAHELRIGGVAPRHFSFGYTQALRELRESTVPHLAREVDRVRPDAVLLTGG